MNGGRLTGSHLEDLTRKRGRGCLVSMATAYSARAFVWTVGQSTESVLELVSVRRSIYRALSS